jgi:hypothetical protein
VAPGRGHRAPSRRASSGQREPVQASSASRARSRPRFHEGHPAYCGLVATWLAGGRCGADEAYDDALEAADLEPEDRSAGCDEPAHPGTLAAQLRRAGFAGATAREAELDHGFSPEGYLAFMSQFDDEDRFATLDDERRQALEADLLARLRAMGPEGLRMRLPIAYVRGRRSRRP